jgi:hypothetical protein
MKQFPLLLGALLVSPALFANGFEGSYHCTGYDPYIKKDYSGTVVISQQNAVYKLTMKYDTGQTYNATGGQYNDELLSVVFQDKKNLKLVGLEQYHLSDDKKTMGGFWVYLGKDMLGKETCIKDLPTTAPEAKTSIDKTS